MHLKFPPGMAFICYLHRKEDSEVRQWASYLLSLEELLNKLTLD